MIEAFTVGAVFRIINQASPTLTAILRQVRALNEQINKAKLAIADLGTIPTTGIKTAIGETDALAASWRGVAAAAGQAKAAIGTASLASSRAGALAAIGGAGGRGRAGGGGFQWRGPRAGTAAAIGLAGLGWGIDQSMREQDAIFRAEYAAGLPHDRATNQRFADIIESAMKSTGYSVGEVSAAVLQATRMLQGTPGNGLSIIPELLKSAANEARNKDGTSLSEALTSQIGLAHMTKTYDPAGIKSLMSSFGFLSTALPMSLQQMERAASYSVPMLQSGLGIDPQQSLLLGAMLARAGVTSSKSGTWLRDLFTRALPGTTSISKTAFGMHENALKQLGLVDVNGKPTWMTNGHLDTLKFIDMASTAIQKIPVEQRAAVLKSAFGQRGAGAAALLTDPTVLDQTRQMLAIESSQAFKTRFADFGIMYNQDSSLQKMRTAMADLNLNLMKIGTDVLPGVNKALSEFITVMDKVRDVIPGAAKNPQATATIGADTIWGAGIGAAVGSFVPGVGTVAGGVVGGLAGGTYGVAKNWMTTEHPLEKFSSGVVSAGKSFENSVENAGRNLASAFERYLNSIPQQAFPGGSSASSGVHHISLSLNLDGRTLAEAMSSQLSDLGLYTSGGPTSNDSGRWQAGDDYSPDI